MDSKYIEQIEQFSIKTIRIIDFQINKLRGIEKLFYTTILKKEYHELEGIFCKYLIQGIRELIDGRWGVKWEFEKCCDEMERIIKEIEKELQINSLKSCDRICEKYLYNTIHSYL